MPNTIVVLLPGTTGSTLITPEQDYEPLISGPLWPDQVMEKLASLAPTQEESAALALLETQPLYPGIPEFGRTRPKAMAASRIPSPQRDLRRPSPIRPRRRPR
jgi:hypothetical protein